MPGPFCSPGLWTCTWETGLQRYPRIDVELIATDAILDVIEQKIDVAIRVGWLADSSLHATLLGGFESIVCASPMYLASIPEVRSPADLSGVSWLGVSLLSSPHRWTFRDARGAEQTVETHGRLMANSASAVRALALAGAGVSALPDYLVRADLKVGRLVRLLPDYDLAQGGIYAVVPSRRQLPQKVTAFVSFLKSELGGGGR